MPPPPAAAPDDPSPQHAPAFKLSNANPAAQLPPDLLTQLQRIDAAAGADSSGGSGTSGGLAGELRSRGRGAFVLVATRQQAPAGSKAPGSPQEQITESSCPQSAAEPENHHHHHHHQQQQQVEENEEALGYIFCAATSLAVHMIRIVVDPAARRQGLGRALLEAALSHALAARRVQAATLHVSPGNTPALALYRSVGFSMDARLEGYYGSTGGDAVRLVKHLVPPEG